MRRLAKNIPDIKTDDNCARKTLGPWLVATAVLICAAIALAFYHADDMRIAREAGPAMKVGPFQQRSSARTATVQTIATKQQAAFVPPWHNQQTPDAVTGATPKRASFNQAIEVASPSVVGINTTGPTKQGASGIVVNDLGYVLTNHHVVEGAESITVTLIYGQLIKSYSATLISAQPDMDLALLKINNAKGEIFPVAPLGDSSRILVGQDVIAIGNPFGLTQSASAGIISNANRSLTAGTKVFNGMIQTDASINPGSSGGALVNSNGEVIGVNAAIYSPVQGFTGVSFAIPINQAKAAFGEYIQIVPSPLRGVNVAAVAPQLKQVGFPDIGTNLKLMARRQPQIITRCWAGIDVCSVNPILAREFKVPFDNGVLVNRVFKNSPAGRAGLRRGDVIYRLNNRRVRDAKMAWSFLAGAKSGDVVAVTLFRNTKRKTFALTLEPEPANIRALLSKTPPGQEAGEIEEISWIGIDIQPLEAGEATQEFGVNPDQAGVFVGEVEGIAAIAAGVQAGDVIKKINNKPVNDIEAFRDVIINIDPSKGVVFDIVRQKRPFYITIQAGHHDRGAWQ